MTDTKSPFVCVPFNELPSETQPGATPESVEAEKKKIREDILSKTNAQIVSDDAQRPESAKAMKLMRALGSDLNINAFALNFRLADGSLNDDIEEANYLMQRVVEDLSVDEPTDDPTKIPLYLTSTEFSDDLYGECKKHFVKRLGLEPSTKDLMVLRNVVMSPFPTDRNFISHLAKIFYDKVEEHVKVSSVTSAPRKICVLGLILTDLSGRLSESATRHEKTFTASSFKGKSRSS